jgi:hypothetical protein
VNILGSLFGCLYLSPQTGGQYFISVALGMDEALTCTLGFLRSIVRDLSKLGQLLMVAAGAGGVIGPCRSQGQF